MFLTPEQLEQLTGRHRPGWQARVLDALDPPIPYRRRPDGTLIVLRIHVECMQDARPREPQLRLA